ncbi:MAG: TetR/AcrR family transcriptional regulator, partial [Saccharofermentans sp.]|nr:TetR/AcrR family transcriptional regulator [Saccharofermentans sp.]
DAGVTNGAFYAHFNSKDDLFGGIVQPYIDGLDELYENESDRFFEIKSAEDVLEAFRKAYSSIDRIIQYLCDNREIFILILESSDGTVYENFAKDIIDAETESMVKFLKKSRSYVKNLDKVSKNIIKTGCSMMIETIFDGVKNGRGPDEILKESALVSEFCIAGYKHILGI